MSTSGEVAGEHEAVVVGAVLLVLSGWVLFARRRRGEQDLADQRSAARAATPQSLYQLLAWALASDGRTARLIALLMVLLLLVTLNDTLARTVSTLVGGP
ncbi:MULTISPECIES: hypothetical protein [unclassified Micromonospora]|uniref:hypothetical protein n=1 Tax=unclassified Micromonospora TaxID=2617518 RepID=UPI001C2508AC|nr:MULTISPECIES: hypothetical protein [unclassified Micromonospora]MBU8857322.1 hypothetical protein [Micromonospora sp. WMMB482]MDM4782945.1 hypothetical protein [Micromonospora sp. b486]